MKIKEVERRVGITSRNIRYYEEEGLLVPERNKENNYREYSEKDVEQLNRIKVLRLLGVPIADIKELNAGSMTLEDAMKRRLDHIQEEKKNLNETQKVCEAIIQRDIPVEALDENILGEEKCWNDRLSEILREDITRITLSGKKLNRNVGFLMAWGYFLNVIVSLIFGDYLLNYHGEGVGASWIQLVGFRLKFMGNWQDFDHVVFGTAIALVVIIIICGLSVHFTSSLKIQIVLFHISALILTPLTAVIYNIVRSSAMDMVNMSADTDTAAAFADYLEIGGVHLAVFWLMIGIFVLALLVISEVWKNVFEQVQYTLGVVVIAAVIMTAAAGLLCGRWLMASIVFLIFTLYIGLSWMHLNMEYGQCSRYYVFVFCSRMMNVGIKALNMRGRANTTLWMD